MNEHCKQNDTIVPTLKLEDNLWRFAHFGQFFAFFTVVIYFTLLGLTIWFDSLTMFATVIGAGAIAGLPALIRSFQKKQDK